MAAYQFENFIKSFPKSDRIQESAFKAAKSYYYQSPTYSLDQINSLKLEKDIPILIADADEVIFLFLIYCFRVVIIRNY